MSQNVFLLSLAAMLLASVPAQAAVIEANPTNYKTQMNLLQPGDTLQLAPGTYVRLYLSNKNGTPEAWIAIAGPASGPEAVIIGEADHNTVEIVNCSYLAIKNLRIDSLHINGLFGISAKGGTGNRTHHILIEGNTLVGQDNGQQTVGISTKTPTWGWIIRRNTIIGAGTGMYLGNSDGTSPFVAGLIENNLIKDTIGYNIEIKYQKPRPAIEGMPVTPSSTVIRNNTFIKNDQPSPSGDRPNLLVGGFPNSGPGSEDLYEIYGNFFYHNPREALLQASGRVTIHHNIFVDAGPYDPAVNLRNHDLPLKLAHVYHNTIYTIYRGISFGSPAPLGDAVIGNLVFAATPIRGSIVNQSDNLVDTLENAVNYVNAPSFVLGAMDFYPLPGMRALVNPTADGPPNQFNLDLFRNELDYDRDFNYERTSWGVEKTVFRGAYLGQGKNPGWQLQDGIKP
jgi:hypothetical protein